MSIIRLALRICAVEALKGQTGVKDNVFDSLLGVLASNQQGQLETPQEQPFIAVFTETALNKDASDNALRSNDNLDLVFEFAVTSRMSETNSDGESQMMGIPVTDGVMEAFLDILETDITRVLNDPENEWAECWRKLKGRIVEVEHRRVGNETFGVSLAAHQLRIRLNALLDPVLSDEIASSSAWAEFCRLLNKHNHAYAPVISELLKPNGSDNSNQRRYGLTLETTRSLMVD